MTVSSANFAQARKITTFSVPLVFVPCGYALAEVCDKVRPGWKPGGPARQLEELIFFVTNPYFAGYALIVLVFGTLFRPRYVFLPLALPPLFVCWVLLSEWWRKDSVTQAAISEGCVGPPYLTAIFLLGLSAFVSRRLWQKAT